MRSGVFLLAVALAAPGMLAAEPLAPTITVSGEGKVTRAPDMATITLAVTADAATGAAAMAKVATGLTGVLARLKGEGIDDRDMQTSGLNLSPRWDDPGQGSTRPPKIVGFEAASTVSVRVRALDHLGPVLDGVVSDGANGFSGLSFGLADPDPAQDDARKAAVADALHKAQLYAAAAGVKLGQVQSISDESASTRPYMMAAPVMMAKSAPMPVAQGEIELDASVTMVFSIAP
ncbi:MAG: DUF541 domain-containing protein [Rhodobacteraceae bacterium]|nr:DUF541 domain-containing protein [Paracoccaceae bacterium]